MLRSRGQLLQLALNEPDCSEVHTAAKHIVSSIDVSYIDWITKCHGSQRCLSQIDATSVILSMSVSKDGQLLAVGGENCRAYVYQLDTCEVSIFDQTYEPQIFKSVIFNEVFTHLICIG